MKWMRIVGVVAACFGVACGGHEAPQETLGQVQNNLIDCTGLPEWTVKSYSGGDRVKHGGAAYQCKPFPYSGWCGQVGYEPGVSTSWADAWTRVDACGGGGGGTGGGSSTGNDTASQVTSFCPTGAAQCCPAGYTAVPLTSGADTYQTSKSRQCVVGLGGINTIAAQGNDEVVIGGPDTDIIQAANGNNVVVPGPGLDIVSTGTGDDTVYIFDLCELQPGETIDTGSGNDTLIAPVPLSELQARGLKISNVERVVVEDNSCRSLCGQPYCLHLPPRNHLVSCTAGGVCTFTTQIPNSSTPEDVALSASTRLSVDDGAFVKELSGGGSRVVVSGGGAVTIGADARVGDVITDGNVVLKARARIDGFVRAGGTIAQDTSATITDFAAGSGPVDSIRSDSWSVTFPSTTQDVSVAANTQRSLTPGAYRSVTVGGTLKLSQGAYTFDVLSLQSGSQVLIDNTTGPVQLAVRTTLALRGRVNNVDAARPNVRLLYAGSTPVTISAPFLGTLVAPAASVTLSPVPSPGHRGAIFAKDIELQPLAILEHRPVRDELCESGQCRPLTPQPSTLRTAGEVRTAAWRTPVPVTQLAASVQALQAKQVSCHVARDLCDDTLAACADDADPGACNDQVVCTAVATTCLPLEDGGGLPGYTSLTDPTAKFLRTSEVKGLLGLTTTTPTLRFGGARGEGLVYKQFVDLGDGFLVPLMGRQAVVQISDDGTSVQQIASSLQDGFAVPGGTLMDTQAAIDLAVQHVRNNNLFAFDVPPVLTETELKGVRIEGRDVLAYLVPFRSPALPNFVGGRVMVDGKTGNIVLARQAINWRKPTQADFAPVMTLDPRIVQLFFQNLACRDRDGHGTDRFGADRLFSTSLLPAGVGNEMVYGTVSCDEPEGQDPPLRRFDVATFVPGVQDNVTASGFVPLEDAYKMVYTSDDDEFFEDSAVEAQFWGAKITQYYRALNAKYGVGPGEADVRISPDGNGRLPRIRMLSVADAPNFNNAQWFEPAPKEKSITASNGVTVFGAPNPDQKRRAWTDPGAMAHEFFHSVTFDHIGISSLNDTNDSRAIAEGLSDCFEMVTIHHFQAQISHAADIPIDPFHLSQGILEDVDDALNGLPSLVNPHVSARGSTYEYWAGERTPDSDGHRNSTLISGVCKLLITGGVNPVLGGNPNQVGTNNMAVIPLPNRDNGQTSLTQSHQDTVVVNQEENMSHLEELLLATVQSGRITPSSTFRNVIDAFANSANDVALRNQKANTGRWGDHVPYYFFPDFVYSAFSAYGWGRLTESDAEHGPAQVAPLATVAGLNLIGANENDPEPIEGCTCKGQQDFFVLNERVRTGDTISFRVESNGQIATKIFVKDPCAGFNIDPKVECQNGPIDLQHLRYSYASRNALPECKLSNQIYPELCAPEDPENIPQSGSVTYEQPGSPVVFIGVTNGPMGGDRRYKLTAWVHHENPLFMESN